MTQLVLQHYAHPARRPRLWIGLLISLVGLGFGVEQGAQWLTAHPMAAHGLQASLLAGLATGIGALPVLFLRRPAARLMAPLLGLAGGMMLAASLFSLLVPAIQSVSTSSAPLALGSATVLALLLGAAAMQHFDRQTEHAHVERLPDGKAAPNLQLVVAAVALHNLPEGLAVGVAAGAGVDHGMSLGIALQNIPEGWIVASALLTLGVAPLRAALVALGTGLIEPVGGLFGALASAVAGLALPLALAGAAGAMLWVVSHELIPASHKPGQETAGSAGLIAGFAVMTGLALAF